MIPQVGTELKPHFDFIVPGRPLSWSRVGWKSGRSFDPPGNKAKKRQIAQYALVAMSEIGAKLTRIPVAVDLRFFGCHHASDLDNLVKLVLDALNGVVWNDDVQVVKLSAFKDSSIPAQTIVEIKYL